MRRGRNEPKRRGYRLEGYMTTKGRVMPSKVGGFSLVPVDEMRCGPSGAWEWEAVAAGI